jgi:hypothetical protein
MGIDNTWHVLTVRMARALNGSLKVHVDDQCRIYNSEAVHGL